MYTINLDSQFIYATGLFAADGYMSSDGRHMEFSSKDKEQVENFVKCLKLKNSITGKCRGSDKVKKYHHVQFGNIKLYKFFQSIGLSNRKSLIIEKLLIPKEFFADFLRGLLDGDGSICIFSHSASKNPQFKLRFSSGSYKFLNWLKSEIDAILRTKGGYIEKGRRVWCLAYCKRDSLKILKYLYHRNRENLICLGRKYEKAKFLLALNTRFNEDRWQNRFTICGRGGIGLRASLRN